MAVKQTAGRTALGEFAPKFAELNDDVLFGQGRSWATAYISYQMKNVNAAQGIARLIQRSHTAMRKRSETLLTNAAFPVRSFLLQQRCGLQTAVMRKQRNHLRNL